MGPILVLFEADMDWTQSEAAKSGPSSPTR